MTCRRSGAGKHFDKLEPSFCPRRRCPWRGSLFVLPEPSGCRHFQFLSPVPNRTLSEPVYTQGKGHTLLAPLRFVWNATRGHRLAPWRSEYLRWRVETYSGQKADTLTTKAVLGFVWTSRW